MPIHESPPPSIRGFGPTLPSGASTPRPRPVTPRGSQEDLSGSSGRSAFHGLHDGPQKHVRIEEPKERGTAWYAGFGLGKISQHRWFAWIAPKLKWKLLQPVIRCSIAVWIGWIIQLIHPSQQALGQAAFFVLIVAFILPPQQAVIQVFEAYANLYFFTALSWAWSCLGIFIAHRVRDPIDQAKVAAAQERFAYARSNPVQYQRLIIFEGTYIQAKSSAVLAVWLGVGCGFLLLYKLRTQPNPATFPIVLACILMDIALTTAVFMPHAYYTAGLLFFLPMAVQGGISLLATLLIFPRSVSSVFQSKFGAIVDPLLKGIRSTEALFDKAQETASPEDSENESRPEDRLDNWAEESKTIRAQLLQSLSGVAPLRALAKYLIVDFSYSRLSGNDLKEVFEQLAQLQIRSAGLGLFYDVIVSNARHSHIDSSAFKAQNSSRPPSRVPSIVEMSEMHGTPPRRSVEADIPASPSVEDVGHRHFPFFTTRKSNSALHSGHAKPSHSSLLDHLRKSQQPVGVYESQRYMDIEKVFEQDTGSVVRQLDLMAEAALPVVQSCRTALEIASEWLNNANNPRRKNKSDFDTLAQASVSLQSALDDFQVGRLQILMPFRHLFDPNHPVVDLTHKMSYRGLFVNFVAEYHVMEFAQTLLRLLRLLERLDTCRTHRQFWYPTPSALWFHFRDTNREEADREGNDEQGNDATFAEYEDELLGEVKKRDPEYMPFENRWLNALSYFSKITDLLHNKSFWYAVKAGAITVLAALPGFLSSSANFYYLNRGVWVLIMAQLTLATFSGDTTTAFLSRLIASFWGCVCGMAAWYIGCGSSPSNPNPYGLAAVAAVTFPMAMFFRIYFPGAVLTAVFGPVTFALVLGYSYLNATLGSVTQATWGWDVAWRRFLSVAIGITAAWIFAYLPPSFSARRAIRHTYSRSIIAAGTVLCEILSDANGHHAHMHDNQETRKKILMWRSKLNTMAVRHQNALHEYSFKGRWPEERYQALQTAVSDLLALLAQLRHVYLQLDRPWRKALLERTRLNDLRFLGDVLAVLTMSGTALRSGTALPQITPSPLVERFRNGKYKGIQLPDSESSEVPTLVTVEVLESEAYMRFAVGVTTTFAIMARLDRIVVICKTLLGESYHISGLHYDAVQMLHTCPGAKRRES